MGLLDIFRGGGKAAAADATPRANATPWQSMSLDDPRLAEFLRTGSDTSAGILVSTEAALRNTAVFRSCDLIASSVGMLPTYLMRRLPEGRLERAEDHPLFDLLLSQPNAWQTAYEFKGQMQLNALTEGDAYAHIVRSGRRILALVPLEPARVTPVQGEDWTVSYRYNRPAGGTVTLAPDEVFHLRSLSRDGINGLSRVRLAREAIALALQAENAAARLFRNGLMLGGALWTQGRLSDPAYARLKADMEDREGADNAHRWWIFEEGLKPEKMAMNATDAQLIEARKHQVEEVARAFGVPRPLLMMDDTSWGSGIEQLGIFFVRYGLDPWFQAWEQGLARCLLTLPERRTLYFDFDEHELLRGSMEAQANFYAKALGAGGQQPWMTPNEVRTDTGLGQHADGDSLANPMMGQTVPPKEKTT